MFQTSPAISIGLMGKGQVGKTLFLHNYLHSTLQLSPTIAAELSCAVHRCLDDTKILIAMWDTSGQQKYAGIIGYHLRNCDGLIFIYDITDRSSFDALDSYQLTMGKQNVSLSQRQILVLGNKIDLVDRSPTLRKVSIKEGKAKASKLGGQFYEISAKDAQEMPKLLKLQGKVKEGESIQEIMHQFVEGILQKKNEKQIQLRRQGIIIQSTELEKQQIPQINGRSSYCGSDCNIY